MSSKGAIKKVVESSSLSKIQASQKVKTRSSSQSLVDIDEKIERRDRRREPQIIDARAGGDRRTSTDKKPKTADTKDVGDRKLKTATSILPDKNPIKLRQSKQNGLSSSKSSFEESPRSSSVFRKSESSRRKSSESTSKTSHNDKTKSSVRKTTKEKVQAQYNEKRGISSVYVPQDSASKLSSMIKASNKQNKEKTSMTKKVLSRSSSNERRKSRTLSPSEVKFLHPKNKNSKSSKPAKLVKEKVTAKNESGDEYSYGDDIEDYESDLEEYSHASQMSEDDHSILTSLDMEPIVLKTQEKKRVINSADVRKSDEEHMLDSGHYELAEAKKRAAVVESLMASRMKTPPPLPELKKRVNQNYREEKQSDNKSLPSSTDEGFEDARSGDFIKSPSVSQITLINHEKTKLEKMKKPRKPLTRGQILMNMIKLDTVEWSLYESKPISYDEFIRSYGKLNTQQVSTQTNEDNLDVEIQTESIDFENKWTQFPVKCRNKLNTVEDVRVFKMEHVGVGSDAIDTTLLASPSYDVLCLNEFLSKAGKVMLALLEEKEFGGTILQNETHEFPFSEGFIKLSVNSLSFLCGRQVTMLHYAENSSKILMSIHAAVNGKMESSSYQDFITECCIGCVWNVNQPSRPIKLFYSQSPITACCFHCTINNIVFAGLEDGSLCIWDLREDETCHQKIIDKVNEMDWNIRSPTYTTAGNWEMKAHMCPIVSIRILSKMGQDETEDLNDKFVSIQICSLDEDGRLIIWSVLRNLSVNSDDLGLTQWGKVKLVKSQEVPLFVKKNELNNMKKQFVDMNIDDADRNNLYLATNDTNILYVNCIGGRNNTIYYKMNETDSCGTTTCIEVCPFKQSYFFAGCNDGSIRLHSVNVETPLLKLRDENSSAGIRSIQWSKSKPLTIYVLDEYSRILVWDLSNNDIYPTHTVSTKTWGYVKCMRLSPCNTNRDMSNQYIALGTDTGNVEVHKLKKNFCVAQQNEFKHEMNTFLQYVSVL